MADTTTETTSWVEEVTPDHLTFTLHLLYNELSFDIQYAVIKRAKIQGVEGKAAKNYKFTDSDNDWMKRAVDKAVYDVKRKTAWCCNNVEIVKTDDLSDDYTEYDMHYKFEGVHWLESADTLLSDIHSYIVDKCVSEWLQIAEAQSYQLYENRAAESLRKIEESVNHVILDNDPKFIL